MSKSVSLNVPDIVITEHIIIAEGKKKTFKKYFTLYRKIILLGKFVAQCWFNTSSDALYIFPFMWMKVLVAQGYFVKVGKPEQGSMRLRPPTLLMWWLLCYG